MVVDLVEMIVFNWRMSEMSVKDVEGPEEQVPHLMMPGGILNAFSVPGGIPSTYVHRFIILNTMGTCFYYSLYGNT